jgi:glucose 1-dehydrogenase
VKRFEGKVALITGASRGIGRGIALHLAGQGADVVVNYHSHRDEAEGVVEAITRMGRQALAWQADVADREAVARMVAATVEHLGHLDIVVANAGVDNWGTVLETDWEANRRTLEVTQFGVFHVCQTGAQQMVEQSQGDRKGGKIIIISSIHEQIPFAGRAAYNMAKAAINHLGRTMAIELASHQINVNVINPGWIDTPGERQMFGDQAVEEGGDRVPWGRMGTPEDIARVVAFLASDDADYVTGATVLVDGGMALAGALL